MDKASLLSGKHDITTHAIMIDLKGKKKPDTKCLVEISMEYA